MNVQRFALAVVVLALSGAGALSGSADQQRDDTLAKGPVVRRSVVATTLVIVSASQPSASCAGGAPDVQDRAFHFPNGWYFRVRKDFG